jgi:hypothetical protein
MVSDKWLGIIPVTDERGAMKDSINSALRVRGARVYREETHERNKGPFRAEWESLIRQESQRYIRATQPISDDQHCDVIRKISENLSSKFGNILQDGALRYGISQKALNLYLKYLWRLKRASIQPPHCPVDGVVLREGGILGSWTKCKEEKEYRDWIDALRINAKQKGLSLSEWEYEIWMKAWLDAQKRGDSSKCS